MKRYLLAFLFLFTIGISKAQPPCQLSLDDFYLDTTAGDCNHLFFKYDISGGTATSFYWDYGDGNNCTCIHPKNVYNKNGNFEVCGKIKDANGCEDSLCKTFTVYCADPCKLSELGIYSADTLSYACDEYEFVTITSDNTKRVRWYFDDGDSSDQKYVIHKFKQNGTYDVRLIINDSINCADTSDFQIKIDCPIVEPCNYKLIHLDTLPFQSANTKKFIVSGNKPYKSLFWELEDNISKYGDSIMQHKFGNTGNYEVCVIGTDSMDCKDTICKEIIIHAIDVDAIEKPLNYDAIYKYFIVNSENIELEILRNCRFILFDGSGRQLLLGELHAGYQKIDVRSLSSGIYTISLSTDSETLHLRLYKP